MGAGTRMQDTPSREQQAAELAADIMMLARNELLVHFRFLDRTIGHIRFVPSEDVTFATDGRAIYYSPWFVLNMYMMEQTAVARNMLHCMLHCVFRHNYIVPDIHRSAWDLACDVAVEAAIRDLPGEMIAVRRSEGQDALLRVLTDKVPVLTAERIFHVLEKEAYTDAILEKERIPFVGDDHAGWYQMTFTNEGVNMDVDLRELWEDIAKRMQTELEVVLGSEDALTQGLRDINRTRYSYTEFLRRFGVHGEIMRLSDEEFDYNYYTYGMDLYGNTPLIEPLEYRDEKKIRDFVIAIDTSGSVKGDVVQRFVQHTHDILSQTAQFEERTNLYILQCDDRIEDAAYIQDAEAFDKYLSTMEIKGLGETDFRPVFAYVEKLLAERKLTDLRGLIYFTDGKGVFPSEWPGYDVAFILHDNGLRNVWTPEWAMKLYLTEEDILDDAFGR